MAGLGWLGAGLAGPGEGQLGYAGWLGLVWLGQPTAAGIREQGRRRLGWLAGWRDCLSWAGRLAGWVGLAGWARLAGLGGLAGLIHYA